MPPSLQPPVRSGRCRKGAAYSQSCVGFSSPAIRPHTSVPGLDARRPIFPQPGDQVYLPKCEADRSGQSCAIAWKSGISQCTEQPELYGEADQNEEKATSESPGRTYGSRRVFGQ